LRERETIISTISTFPNGRSLERGIFKDMKDGPRYGSLIGWIFDQFTLFSAFFSSTGHILN